MIVKCDIIRELSNWALIYGYNLGVPLLEHVIQAQNVLTKVEWHPEIAPMGRYNKAFIN